MLLLGWIKEFFSSSAEMVLGVQLSYLNWECGQIGHDCVLTLLGSHYGPASPITCFTHLILCRILCE